MHEYIDADDLRAIEQQERQRVTKELERLRAELAEAQERIAELKDYIQQMVKKAADNSLEGYRELGRKCAELEEQRDRLRAELAETREWFCMAQEALEWLQTDNAYLRSYTGIPDGADPRLTEALNREGVRQADLENAVSLVSAAGLSTGHADSCTELVREVLEQVEGLRGRVVDLENALEPLAALGDVARNENCSKYDDSVIYQRQHVQITVGQCERALRTLGLNPRPKGIRR